MHPERKASGEARRGEVGLRRWLSGLPALRASAGSQNELKDKLVRAGGPEAQDMLQCPVHSESAAKSPLSSHHRRCAARLLNSASDHEGQLALQWSLSGQPLGTGYVVSSCMALGHPRCRRSRPSIQSGPPDVRELSACCCSSNRTRPTAHSNTNIKRGGAEPADAHSARAPARHGRVARAMRAVQAASPASSPVQQQAQAAWRALRTAGAEQVTH